MKEMIKKVREDKEGFTLAELLVVVAIIAVLVAIAIPVFNASLTKSQYETDIANARSYYAECQMGVLDGHVTSQATIPEYAYGNQLSGSSTAATFNAKTDTTPAYVSVTYTSGSSDPAYPNKTFTINANNG